jgi:hypothetical protein
LPFWDSQKPPGNEGSREEVKLSHPSFAGYLRVLASDFFFIQSFIKEAQKLVIMAHACNLKRRRQEDLNLKAS